MIGPESKAREAGPRALFGVRTILQPLVGHMAKIIEPEIGHHHAVGMIEADILAVDPDQLVIVEMHQQRFDIAVGGMRGTDHRANMIAGDQFNALADRVGVALDDGPMMLGPKSR
jgi:hypothetical protein